MRNRTTILIGALLLVLPGVAQAQQTQPATTPATQAAGTVPATSNASTFAPKSRIDFGVRGNSIDGDPARFQRFRDERDGAYIPMFRFENETETSFFHAEANNVGYRDQRFAANYENIGKLKLDFEWNQIPLYISSDTRSLYTDNGSGVLSINPAARQSIQDAGLANSPAAYAALSNALTQARQFDLRSRRDVGAFNLTYTLNRDVDLKFNVKNTNRTGHNLMSFGFGTSPGLNPSVEVGVPTDDRTTNVNGMLEFANKRGMFSVGFAGSSYNNNIPVVQFDNPLRATDAPGGSNVGGPASGRVPMWPTNSAFSLNLNGSYKLPVRSRASAAISVGRWNQNEALIAPTSNTALVAPPLERPNAEAKADIVSMVYNFVSRPSEYVWLNAKYRYYDYANKTPLFEMPALVGDWAFNPATAATWENEPSSMQRRTFDVDASFTPYQYVAFGVGLTREDADRTHRIFENTAENSYRVSVDSTGNQYVTLRAKYEHSRRTGSGFEEALLDEVGEQPLTRHFDIADRDRDRATAIFTVTPIAQFDINASVSTGKDDYRNTGFGLRDNKNNSWSLGFDLLPVETVSFGMNYGFEKYTAFQYSHTANPDHPSFNDPTRDWGMDSSDKVKTLSANLDLLRSLPKTDIRLSYDLSDGKATYLYQLTPGSTITTGVVYGPGVSLAAIPVVQLPTLKNKLTDGRIDVSYFVRQNIALGVGYWYEAYNVDDFSLNSSTTGQLNPTNVTTGVFANTIYSGYLYRNYTAHSGWLRMSYLW
jgi:MtrB/PioB family decaheme-associated outer membrane protein